MWQATLRGLTIGDGTPYQWDADGLDLAGLAGYRSPDQPRGQRHGVASPGPDYLAGKTLTFPLLVLGADDADVLARVEALTAAFAPGAPVDLVVRTPRGVYQLHGKPRRISVALTHVAHGVVQAIGQFLALDPIFRAHQPTTTVAPINRSAGGLGFPHGFPHAFGTAGPGEAACTNAGTAPTPLRAVLTAGPAGWVDPTLTLASTGETVAWDTTIPFGQHLVVDFAEHQALLTATPDDLSVAVNRADEMVRPAAWWELPAGTHVVRVGGGGEGQALLEWRSAWWL